MRRDQLEHAIRTACQIIGRPEVIVVGSQAILGTFREDQLPADATMSVEVDIQEKDRNFVAALLRAGLVDTSTVLARLATVHARHRAAVDRAAGWLRSRDAGSPSTRD